MTNTTCFAELQDMLRRVEQGETVDITTATLTAVVALIDAIDALSKRVAALEDKAS